MPLTGRRRYISRFLTGATPTVACRHGGGPRVLAVQTLTKVEPSPLRSRRTRVPPHHDAYSRNDQFIAAENQYARAIEFKIRWRSVRKPGKVCGMKFWKLHYRPLGRGPQKVGEQIFLAEVDLVQALQSAYRNFGTDLAVTLPDGTSLSDVELRERYPPQ